MKSQTEFALDGQITPPREIAKAIAAEEEGADTLMELLAGGDLDEVRRAVLNATSLPVGNVPAEHLALPYVEDVREGVRATKIAARIGDIAKYLNRRENEKKETCTMCGDFCAMKKGMEVFKEDIKKDKINSIV